MLLDYEGTVGTGDAEPVPHPLPVSKAVAVEMYKLVDLVRLLKPLSQKQLNDRVSAVGLQLRLGVSPRKSISGCSTSSILFASFSESACANRSPSVGVWGTD